MRFKNSITQQMFRTILETGLDGHTIGYRALGERLGIPHEHNLMGIYLGEISEWSFEKHGVFLTALVVHSSGDRKPGPGFLELAWKLNHKRINDLTFLDDEIKRAQVLCKKLM